MSEIDDIKPSEDTMMTDQLIRIFKSQGCSPTECHGCGEEIKTGDIFKLVPHPKTNYFGDIEGDSLIDEMCCKDCESVDLTLRDKRLKKDRYKYKARQLTGGGGFSRPSKLSKEKRQVRAIECSKSRGIVQRYLFRHYGSPS